MFLPKVLGFLQKPMAQESLVERSGLCKSRLELGGRQNTLFGKTAAVAGK